MIFSLKQWLSDWATALFVPDYRVESYRQPVLNGTTRKWRILDADGVLVEDGFLSESAALDKVARMKGEK